MGLEIISDYLCSTLPHLIAIIIFYDFFALESYPLKAAPHRVRVLIGGSGARCALQLRRTVPLPHRARLL
jgi:hypothetical protein